MNSNKSDKTDAWAPSSTYYPVPTLIIPCGGDADRLANLRYGLDRRIGAYVADGLVRWTPVLNPSETVSEGQLSDIDFFFKYDLWQRLVDKGYIQHLPDADHPLQLQVLVICDMIGGVSYDTVIAWLEKLPSAVESKKSKIGEQAECSLALVILGDPAISHDKLKSYWPRIYLSKTGWGGTRFNSEQIFQTCQNVIAGFVASELPRSIDYVAGKSHNAVQWIALGASSVLVDLAAVRERYDVEVLEEFLEPLIQDSLTENQCRILDDGIDAQVHKLQSSLLIGKNVAGKDIFGVKEICEQHGWDFKATGQVVERCSPLPTSDIARKGFGSQWWLEEAKSPVFEGSFYRKLFTRIKYGVKLYVDLLLPVPLPSPEIFASLLAENYRALDAALQAGLRHRAGLEYQHLLDIFAFLLNRDSYAGENRPLPLDPNLAWPTGLRAVDYAINRAIDRLTHSADIQYAGQDIHIASIGTDEYWKSAAAEDALVVEGALRRYKRLDKSLSSIWGVILKILVAFPLLYGLLDIFTSWPQWIVILLSALALAILGLVESVVWRLQARQLLRQVREEVNTCLSKRVLSLVSKSLYDYRMIVISHLRPVIGSLRDFQALIVQEHQKIRSRSGEIASKATSREDGSLYRIVDFKRALGTEKVKVKDDLAIEWEPLKGEFAHVWREVERDSLNLSWKSEARKSANVEARRVNENFKKVETALISKYILPLIENPASPLDVIRIFEETAARWGEREFKPRFMETYVLAEEVEALKEGAKWRWLFQHAHPLGDSGKSKDRSLFTVILVPDDNSLVGSTGRGSSHWQSDWLVARSRQTHEISCIRGVVEKSCE